jgi:hypothetical protein
MGTVCICESSPLTRRTPLNQWKNDFARRQYFDLDDTTGIMNLTDDQSTAWGGVWTVLFMVRGVKYTHYCTRTSWSDSNEQSTFRFYGSLDDSQKRQVCGTTGLSATSLSIPQSACLARVTAATQDWDVNGSLVRRVGVYNSYGVRIDKPDASLPVSIRIEKRESRNYTVESLTTTPQNVTASSPEDAWNQFLKKCPDTCAKPHFFARDAGYVMVLTFQDGSTKEIPMPVAEPVEAVVKSQ